MAQPPSSPGQTVQDPARARQRRRRRGWYLRVALLAIALAWASIAIWQISKPMPPGSDVASAWSDTALGEVRLLTDVTVTDGRERLLIRQQIFDEVLRAIDTAQEFIVLDWFLFNDHRGPASREAPAAHRALSAELRDRLLARRLAKPDLRVLFITDPINDIYGSAPSADLATLREAGVEVVVTDLDRLRDSNPLYSALWRLTARWWADAEPGTGRLANPLDTGPARISLGAWLELLNFKANHRKLLVADDGAGKVIAIVCSANPHDASSAHSNIGLRFSGLTAHAALVSELAVARFSGWSGDWPTPAASPAEPAAAVARLKFLSEGRIEDALLSQIRTANAGESIAIAVFYLSDRDVVDELVGASARGVRIRLILDPNKDAFGRVKDGVPNRPVAAELRRRSAGNIEIRWYRTHGEQFHTKLALVRRADSLWAMLGSANFTRRNLGNYNLEANVALETDLNTPLAQELINYFETLWQNDPVATTEFTTDFQTYEDQSLARYWRYRLMEATGMSTF
ncbi:MAG TPA: phospholipase D-like domain-containing protein [Steroidobacteraceae bacterium]|nr:phospholipase D-like domain-containing protein [Steroidobacteraceae bacterium]